MQDTRHHELEPATAPAPRADHLAIAPDERIPPCVEIVVPVFNEAATLDDRIATLHAYLTEHFPFSWRITIVDNASTDGTWFHAARLARDTPWVRAQRLDRKGRGLALRTAWMASDAAVVAYMDVDLSTDLDALLPLVAPLVSGHSDIAIGSRLSPGSAVTRGPKRELISRSYNSILRGAFETRVRDAQCGFKALRADVARALLPLVEDNSWFFDTELLLLAEHNGLRIHEVPVDWVDDPDSRVHIRRTAIDDLRGTVRMLRQFGAGRGTLDLATRGPAETRNAFGPRVATRASMAIAWSVASVARLTLGGRHR
jgi:glycosyltransferase involved in cell wall biosynthesis